MSLRKPETYLTLNDLEDLDRSYRQIFSAKAGGESYTIRHDAERDMYQVILDVDGVHGGKEWLTLEEMNEDCRLFMENDEYCSNEYSETLEQIMEDDRKRSDDLRKQTREYVIVSKGHTAVGVGSPPKLPNWKRLTESK